MIINDIISERTIEPGDTAGYDLVPIRKLSRAHTQAKEDLKAIQELQPSNTQLIARLQSRVDKLEQAIDRHISNSSDDHDSVPPTLMKFFKMADKKCSQIMNTYRKTTQRGDPDYLVLYRGERAANTEVIYGKPFNNRRPVDSNLEFHELINSYLRDSGFTARRDNSIFTIADHRKAAQFGDAVFIIFPVDGFSFTWSSTTRDAIFNVGLIFDFNLYHKGRLANTVKHLLNNHADTVPTSIKEPLNKFVETGDVDDRALSYLPTILQMARRRDNSKILTLEYFVDQDAVMKKMDFRATDLSEAIDVGHEVYINGPYYGLHTKYLKYLLIYLDMTS